MTFIDAEPQPTRLKLQFLGTGNAVSAALGNSSAVLEIGSAPTRLAIDFGFTALLSCKERYGTLPDAIFITHTHLDHIGGLEALFYENYFAGKLIKIFAPAAIIKHLHQRLGLMESILAEGNANFWDAFQLIPVQDAFWFEGLKFHCFPVRHHHPEFCWGLCLPGNFLFTADTKPIPEIIQHYASHNELIFHDLSTHKQPSHTHLDELESYDPSLLKRMWFYHLQGVECIEQLRARGLHAVNPEHCFEFTHRIPQQHPGRVLTFPGASR